MELAAEFLVFSTSASAAEASLRLRQPSTMSSRVAASPARTARFLESGARPGGAILGGFSHRIIISNTTAGGDSR